ncbi:hypothetical protein Tco_0888275, partial [Tanacetum coccineum]
MAGLDFCSKHNMVSYLEKNDGNTKFHQIMDFLTRSSIHFALTVSPIVSTSFVEQFWTSAKSRTINNISYIDALFAGKPVTISEASIRSDLLFDNADGIDTLKNQAIFDTIRNVTPLFNSMLVQPIEDEGEDQPEPQPDLSPRPSSSIPIPDSNPEGSGGNHGDLKAQIKQLKKKARPVINHHKAWFKAARMKKQHKKKDIEKSKKRRSDGLDTDTLVVEDKGSAKKGGSTKGTDLQQSTDKPDEGTDKQDEGTVKPDEGTDKQDESTDSFVEGTAEIKDQVSGESDTPTVLTMTSTPTATVFGDDETIAQRPRPTLTRSLLTLKPPPKIDPKSKGKGMIEEEDETDTESEYINEAEKKFKMLVNDEEMARKVQEEWEAEKEKKSVRNKSSYDLILPTVLKELVLPVQRKMELENSQNNALAKLPMLKLGEYEMWEIRIKQYFQIQDYALWEV